MSKHIKEQIKKTVAKIISSKYEIEVSGSEILLNLTKKEFEGNYTVVIFPFVKRLKMSPADLGAELGQAIVDEMGEISAFNVVAGFVNLSIADEQWKLTLGAYAIDETLTSLPANGKKVMVEFSSPNTNKPLHLGHIRNILLGWSSSQILKAAGYEVINTQIINDRGIAVCKSMLAWQRYGEGATPESSGIKGDHFVGQFYVRFDKELKAEYATWQSTEDAATVLADKAKEGQSTDDFYSKYKNDYFNEYSVLGRDAKEMLRQWEGGDADTVALWKQMNDWVYDGFESTYKALGVSFNKLYYESDTYLLGKEVVEKGLESGVFFKKDDGSAWVDLEAHKMDEKIVLRSDGTAVYMTQDIGTAMQRYADFGIDKMVYVVGDEQNYHFKVLFTILGMLGEPYADNLHHLSYGMVDLPEGRMKSREGTVVDADDLVQEVIAEAKKANDERGEIDELSAEEQADTLRKIGMSALKYFIIKVNPQKRMTFNPAESVDMQGQTGPYIQNAYVRIQSILRKSADYTESDYSTYNTLEPMEKSLMRSLGEFKDILAVAAENLDPSMIANYAYDLGKDYHKFYHDVRILKAESEAAKCFRLQLSRTVALVLRDAMEMLGIEMPERM